MRWRTRNTFRLPLWTSTLILLSSTPSPPFPSRSIFITTSLPPSALDSSANNMSQALLARRQGESGVRDREEGEAGTRGHSVGEGEIYVWWEMWGEEVVRPLGGWKENREWVRWGFKSSNPSSTCLRRETRCRRSACQQHECTTLNNSSWTSGGRGNSITINVFWYLMVKVACVRGCVRVFVYVSHRLEPHSCGHEL